MPMQPAGAPPTPRAAYLRMRGRPARRTTVPATPGGPNRRARRAMSATLSRPRISGKAFLNGFGRIFRIPELARADPDPSARAAVERVAAIVAGVASHGTADVRVWERNIGELVTPDAARGAMVLLAQAGEPTRALLAGALAAMLLPGAACEEHGDCAADAADVRRAWQRARRVAEVVEMLHAAGVREPGGAARLARRILARRDAARGPAGLGSVGGLGAWTPANYCGQTRDQRAESVLAVFRQMQGRDPTQEELEAWMRTRFCIAGREGLGSNMLGRCGAVRPKPPPLAEKALPAHPVMAHAQSVIEAWYAYRVSTFDDTVLAREIAVARRNVAAGIAGLGAPKGTRPGGAGRAASGASSWGSDSSAAKPSGSPAPATSPMGRTRDAVARVPYAKRLEIARREARRRLWIDPNNPDAVQDVPPPPPGVPCVPDPADVQAVPAWVMPSAAERKRVIDGTPANDAEEKILDGCDWGSCACSNSAMSCSGLGVQMGDRDRARWVKGSFRMVLGRDPTTDELREWGCGTKLCSDATLQSALWTVCALEENTAPGACLPDAAARNLSHKGVFGEIADVVSWLVDHLVEALDKVLALIFDFLQKSLNVFCGILKKIFDAIGIGGVAEIICVVLDFLLRFVTGFIRWIAEFWIVILQSLKKLVVAAAAGDLRGVVDALVTFLNRVVLTLLNLGGVLSTFTGLKYRKSQVTPAEAAQGIGSIEDMADRLGGTFSLQLAASIVSCVLAPVAPSSWAALAASLAPAVGLLYGPVLHAARLDLLRGNTKEQCEKLMTALVRWMALIVGQVAQIKDLVQRIVANTKALAQKATEPGFARKIGLQLKEKLVPAINRIKLAIDKFDFSSLLSGLKTVIVECPIILAALVDVVDTDSQLSEAIDAFNATVSGSITDLEQRVKDALAQPGTDDVKGAFARDLYDRGAAQLALLCTKHPNAAYCSPAGVWPAVQQCPAAPPAGTAPPAGAAPPAAPCPPQRQCPTTPPVPSGACAAPPAALPADAPARAVIFQAYLSFAGRMPSDDEVAAWERAGASWHGGDGRALPDRLRDLVLAAERRVAHAFRAVFARDPKDPERARWLVWTLENPGTDAALRDAMARAKLALPGNTTPPPPRVAAPSGGLGGRMLALAGGGFLVGGPVGAAAGAAAALFMRK